MLEVWNTLVLVPFDLLLGRLRAMSPDAVLIVVAVGSAFVLTLVRKWTTDQDLLRRVADDRRRLRHSQTPELFSVLLKIDVDRDKAVVAHGRFFRVNRT